MDADRRSSAVGDARTPRVTTQALIAEIVRRGFYDEVSLTTLLGAARRNPAGADTTELERLLRREDKVSDSALTKIKADTSGYRPVSSQFVYAYPSLPAQVSRATGAVVISMFPVVVAMVEDLPDSVELVSTYVGANFEIQVCTVARFVELYRAAYEYSETGAEADDVDTAATPDEDFSDEDVYDFGVVVGDALNSERGGQITPFMIVTAEERKLAEKQRAQHRDHLLANRDIPRWWRWVWLAGALYFPYAMDRDYSPSYEVKIFWMFWLGLGAFLWYKADLEQNALEELWKNSWTSCSNCYIACQLTDSNMEEYTETHWAGRRTHVRVHSCPHCGEAVHIRKIET